MTDEAIDLSSTLGPVRDQGNRGTCLAFAVTTSHESARLQELGGPREDLSEELLYWACKLFDGNSTSGTTPAAAERALAETGQPLASLWPYDPSRDDSSPLYQPPPEALEPQALHRASLKRLAVDADGFKHAVREGHVVVLALELWDAFYVADGSVLSTPDASELIGDAHAVAMVGFDERHMTIRLRNSWGQDDWGDNGYASLPVSAIPVVCFGAWQVIDPVS